MKNLDVSLFPFRRYWTGERYSGRVVGYSVDLLPNSGDQPPVHTKACPVPAHDSFRGDQGERIFPGRQDSSSDYPEKLIE
jgi:hypothetical protein